MSGWFLIIELLLIVATLGWLWAQAHELRVLRRRVEKLEAETAYQRVLRSFSRLQQGRMAGRWGLTGARPPSSWCREPEAGTPCEDEGCPHHGRIHYCTSMSRGVAEGEI